MTDLEARLRAMNKPCPTAALPDRAMLAARARRRTLRAGTLSGSALAGVVALVAATTGGNAYHSMEMTTTPPPTATSTPVAGAPRSTAAAVPAGRTRVLPTTGTRTTRSLAEPPTAARASATPSPAGPSQAVQEALTPTFWRGAYGPAGFYDVQFVEGAAGDVCPENAAVVVPGVTDGGTYTCYRMAVTPPREHGGGFLTEVAVCRNPSSDTQYLWDGGAPHTYAVHDAETDAAVRTWRPPSTSEPYSLSPGDCAFYLWHLLAADDAGRPLPSGRTYYALVDAHHEVELRSAEFPVPR